MSEQEPNVKQNLDDQPDARPPSEVTQELSASQKFEANAARILAIQPTELLRSSMPAIRARRLHRTL